MKKIKIILPLTLLLIMVFSLSAHAAERRPLNDSQDTRPNVSQALTERISTDGQRPSRENLEERADRLREKMLEVVMIYSPDLYEDFSTAFESHDAVHVALEDIRTSLREEANAIAREEALAYFTELKASVDDGSITIEEAREAMKAYHEEGKAERQAIIEAIQAELEPIHEAIKALAEERKSTFEALRTALESEDEEGIVENLVLAYAQLLEHIQLDEAKLAIISE